jgi:hypothetical protein
VNPRIVSCLLIAFAVGIAGAIWTFMAGWGVLAAFVAYSFFGSVGLITTAFAAALIAERTPAAAEAGALPRAATAHNG